MDVTVSDRGAARWQRGHPWIYRTDVSVEPADAAAGIATVRDRRGRFLGRALYSPASEIRLRLLTTDDVPVDGSWWRARIGTALARRRDIAASAYRVVHAEGDGLPSLVVDRYASFAVAQLLSAGLEAVRDDVVAAVLDVLQPEGLLLRNDSAVRRHEALPLAVEAVHGDVPDEVEIDEDGVRTLAALRTGQKTGAFLDQRENRRLVARAAVRGGRGLDAFSYHGAFAVHLARRSGTVLAVDQSADALARGARNAALNALTNIEWREANAFDLLRDLDRAGERYDTIVLDPPAFAKSRESVARAISGYKEINLRAMRLLAPGGVLFTCSCSYHVNRVRFGEMLAAAAADSRRRVQVLTWTGAAPDHPEVLTVPETAYLKGALLRAVE